MERYLAGFDTTQIEGIKAQTVIVGSGIAGLSTALQLINLGIKPVIITRTPYTVSNSFLAQGGIAAPIGKDDTTALHLQDTLKAGRGLCIQKNAQILVEEGLERVIDLIRYGVDFDKDKDGLIRLTKEGGHSKRRVLHIKDETGKAIATALYNLIKDKVDILEGYNLEEILTEEGQYKGILISAKEKKYIIWSKSLVIATGGYSPIYLRNTSAYTVSGDTIGVSFRAGCILSDLEFTQFHPTALNIPNQPAYLITEALRGEGAILIDQNGNRFIDEMKPRDEVARAIFHKEMEGKKVFLDLTPLKERGISLQERFPTVYNLLKKFNLLDKNKIPVSPAVHYTVGGIQADVNGTTSVNGVFAVGEVASTGVHGANRLASNSLLECITFGSKTAYSVYKHNLYTKVEEVKIKNRGIGTKLLKTEEKSRYFYQIKKLMWEKVGLERTEEGLSQALSTVEGLQKELLQYTNSRELIDTLYLAKGIILSAKNRKESRGTHYRKDFPQEKDYYKKHTKVYNDFKIKLEVN
ncbi:MAG: L-aspartate oxidase [Aquificae bacterium]|nr:L-aspartate oxidase [Aquificota bacterium]